MHAATKSTPTAGQRVKVQYLTRALLVVVVAFLLSGCAPLVDSDQMGADTGPETLLQVGGTIGQTFVARHSGLNGIEVWLTPVQAGQGNLRLQLAASPADQNPLASAILPVADIRGPGFYRFSFPPLQDSHSRYYYAVLELDGDAVMRVGAAAGSAYLDGSLHVNEAPVVAQMAFRLTYDRGRLVLDLGRFGLQSAVRLLAAALLFMVPGWALLVVLRKQRLAVRCEHWAEGLGVAVGLGLAIYPILMLWLNVAHVRAGPLTAFLPVIGGLAVLVWHYRPWRVSLPALRTALRQWWHGSGALPDSVLLIVLLLASIGWFLSHARVGDAALVRLGSA